MVSITNVDSDRRENGEGEHYESRICGDVSENHARCTPTHTPISPRKLSQTADNGVFSRRCYGWGCAA